MQRALRRGTWTGQSLCVRCRAPPRSTPNTRCCKSEHTSEHKVVEAKSHVTTDDLVSVPWQPARFAIAFSQVICLQLALAYGSVGAWAGIFGRQVDGTASDEVDAVLLLSDVLQLLGVLTVVRLSLQQQTTENPSQELQQSVSTPSFPADPPAPAADPPATPLRYTLDAQALGAAAAAAAAALLAMVLLAQASGGGAGAAPETEISMLLRSSSPAGCALLFLSTVVVGPITEELVWRGLLLPSLSAWTGGSWSAPALAVSSLAFAAYHLSPQDLPALTVLGAALGYAMQRSGGNLLAPTLGHALYNLVVLSLAAQDAQQTLP